MRFGLLVLAETVKVFSRLSARLGLVVSLLVGIAMPVLIWMLANSGMAINGTASEAFFTSSGPDAIGWGLTMRNFLLVRAFLVVLGAQAVAGELSERTLREALLRPVGRDHVLYAKFLALLCWDAVSLAVTWLTAGLLGSLALGFGGAWLDVLLAGFLNLCADAGLIALIFMVGVVTRSTVATIAGLLVVIVLDKMIGWGMLAASGVASMLQTSPVVVTLLEQYPLLPSAALGIWAGALPDGELDLRSVASLVILTGVSLIVAVLRLRRLEVP